MNSASPSYAHRDTTLDVRILGSGFTDGAAAEWTRAGVGNPAKVRTNSTQLVSSSELVANITISADADLALWDIAVTLVGGKKGVGTEKFEITTASIIGGGAGIGGYVMATSDQVSVVGYGALSGAWAYDAISGNVVDLGPGQAWAIDPSGTTALGRDGNWVPVAWERAPGGGWTKRVLPNTAARGNVSSVAVAADGSLIAGGWIETEVKRNNFVARPAVWRRVDGVWSQPETYAIPGPTGAIYAVAPTGAAAGRAQLPNGTYRPVAWDSPTAYTVLDGTDAWGINPAGTVVVGDRVGAGYWYRTTSGWVATGTNLPSVGPSCTGGSAKSINSAGIIAGRSCTGSSAHLATVWRLDLSGAIPTLVGPPTGLGGLGPGASNTAGSAITSSPPYVVVGYVDSGSNVTVSWSLP